ncbi:hypothetical protein M6B38_200995 [Iris pallida]|uniref:Uncharacterized protein n=1 Tax=Iris pallida TaxID=29817 RepID=A0AAX6E8S6_IRIPA|nr:hypothetical protein M6B38_200995 [Iris pallida]
MARQVRCSHSFGKKEIEEGMGDHPHRRSPTICAPNPKPSSNSSSSEEGPALSLSLSLDRNLSALLAASVALPFSGVLIL